MRKAVAEKLACLGVKIDDEKNNTRGEVKEISKEDSAIKLFVIPTNEELMIASDTYELISK